MELHYNFFYFLFYFADAHLPVCCYSLALHWRWKNFAEFDADSLNVATAVWPLCRSSILSKEASVRMKLMLLSNKFDITTKLFINSYLLVLSTPGATLLLLALKRPCVSLALCLGEKRRGLLS